MNQTELEMLEILKDVGRFILTDCHKWEKQSKGKYETRKKVSIIGDRQYKISGSGDCVNMAKKIYKLLAKTDAFNIDRDNKSRIIKENK